VSKAPAILKSQGLVFTTAADGTSVRANLILHPGMNTAESHARVSPLLAKHYKACFIKIGYTSMVDPRIIEIS